VFAATMKAMSRLGPSQITLADIAAEASLTAGALVQRFGSKRGLLLALSERFAHSAGDMFAGLRAAYHSPLEALYGYGECMAQMGDTPEELAHHLSWLQQDLTDPDFRRFTVMHARASRRELRRIVADAVRAAELMKDVNASALARAIEVTVTGSLMTWAIHQKGRATDWMRHDLDAVLGPITVPQTRVRNARRQPTPRTRQRPTR